MVVLCHFDCPFVCSFAILYPNRVSPHKNQIIRYPNGGRVNRLIQSKIIIDAFYSPPNSKLNSKLLDHIMSTMHHLLAKYPNVAIILGGDKNDLNLS